MLHNNSKSLLDAVSKIVSESKVKYDEEQQALEAAQKALWEKKLSPKQKVIAAKAGDPKKIDAADFAALRKEEEEKKEDAEQIDELTYSAKAAAAGKDIGKPGKKFAEIAAKSSPAVAGAVLKKLRAKHIKEEAQADELDEARGRPRKNPLPAGSEGSAEEEPDHNIVMHLKKSVDTGGNHDVKFADKSTHKVPGHVAKNVLHAMGKLKPADRLEVQKHIGQSHSNLMQVHGMIK